MTEKEMQEIYARLLELTKQGRLTWRPDGENEFTTSFSRSSVSISTGMSIPHSLSLLRIHNQEGVIVAVAANDTDLIAESLSVFVFALDPSELFNLVQESVYKYSETSQNILHELRELATYRPAA